MYTTGAIKDKPDERDYLIKDFLAGAILLPPEYDLSDKMPPVRFQGTEPACVAFSACVVKGYEEKLEGHKEYVFSPRFLYDRIAQPQGGAYLRDVMKVLAEVGVPPESCEPYIENQKGVPCEKALELAAPNKIKAYARLQTLNEIKQCLVENGAFIIALYVNSSWDLTTNGLVTSVGEITGAHAVVFVGYDDTKQQVKFFNSSWGESWGDKGFGYVSYQDFDKVLMDAWSSVDIPDAEEPKKPEESQHITNNGALIDYILKLIKSIFGGK